VLLKAEDTVSQESWKLFSSYAMPHNGWPVWCVMRWQFQLPWRNFCPSMQKLWQALCVIPACYVLCLVWNLSLLLPFISFPS